MYVYFNETAASGSVIFVSNETKAIRKEWSLSSYDPRVALTFVKGTYQVVLLSAVDLDVANLGDICSPPEQFVQRITCYRNGQDPIIHWITFQVQPVNENPPEADTLPEIRISEKDVGEYFMINSSTGFLSQVKHFDYEDTEIQCNLGKGGGFVKIIAEDGLYKTSKSLSVTFINIDDAPPVFVNSDCSTVCYKCPILSLSAIVHFTYHGPILTNPPGIKAIDLDTEQSNIIDYNLDIYPTKYKDIIRFEDGRFVLLQSFANFSEYKKESDFTVIVTIQATGSNGQTGNCTLLIRVVDTPGTALKQTTITKKFETTPTTTSNTLFTKLQEMTSLPTGSTYTPSNTTSDRAIKKPKSSHATSDSTKDIVIIVLAVVVGLLISACIIHTVCRIRNQKTKSDNKVPSYEEVKRNNDTKENEYATIQN
eukprot:XP_019922773.1 PREDICTED: uncharacterized protein LOC105328185 isoform X2 [Crassostrea gigas]